MVYNTVLRSFTCNEAKVAHTKLFMNIKIYTIQNFGYKKIKSIIQCNYDTCILKLYSYVNAFY